MKRIFWLSFCDPNKPKGEQFLGACIIEVTAQEVVAFSADMVVRFPNAQPNAEWIYAAMKKAHQLGCNPGGEMASYELPTDHPNLARYVQGVLMDKATIEVIDEVIG